jgi:manganese efflux pump family protein
MMDFDGIFCYDGKTAEEEDAGAAVEIITLILLGLSLSMDTLAVSVTIGICKADIRPRHILKAAAFFAFFQTLMPGLGYLAGSRVASLIKPYDHWISFGLLALIGGKMIYETLHEKAMADTSDEDEAACRRDDPTASRRLAGLALATSIDALAAGISLAFSKTPVVTALLIIGLITFVVAAAGTALGRRLGVLFQRRACLVGGAVLILIGIKIVADHLLAG